MTHGLYVVLTAVWLPGTFPPNWKRGKLPPSVKERGPTEFQQLPWCYTDQPPRQEACLSAAHMDFKLLVGVAEIQAVRFHMR